MENLLNSPPFCMGFIFLTVCLIAVCNSIAGLIVVGTVYAMEAYDTKTLYFKKFLKTQQLKFIASFIALLVGIAMNFAIN